MLARVRGLGLRVSCLWGPGFGLRPGHLPIVSIVVPFLVNQSYG